jgi:tripartite-type tricarboxylate transporter receptor subunit TctC
VKRVLALPDVKQRFTDLGMSLGGGTPSELDIYIKKSSRRPKFERPTNTML